MSKRKYKDGIISLTEEEKWEIKKRRAKDVEVQNTKRHKGRNKVPATVQARRDRICELWLLGFTISKISDIVDCSEGLVNKDLNIIKRKLERPENYERVRRKALEGLYKSASLQYKNYVAAASREPGGKEAIDSAKELSNIYGTILRVISPQVQIGVETSLKDMIDGMGDQAINVEYSVNQSADNVEEEEETDLDVVLSEDVEYEQEYGENFYDEGNKEGQDTGDPPRSQEEEE